jgi:RNA-directed DNA polymerase
MLIDAIADLENLYHAFKECSRSKTGSSAYAKMFLNLSPTLTHIHQIIKRSGTYPWQGYREFWVRDPKRRLIMAAPFQDRVVHTAIHRVLAPLLEADFGQRSYACRKGMGNHRAILALSHQLKFMAGGERYAIKMDIKSYFASIQHAILLEKLHTSLNDTSILPLIHDLLVSHHQFKSNGFGIPIGNLTSQLFANLYLRDLDKTACRLLNLDYNSDLQTESFYIRYMDDIVVVTRDKKSCMETCLALREYAAKNLQLSIPPYKFMVLGADPIPFLGFVVVHKGSRLLSRNMRRFAHLMRGYTHRSASFRARRILCFETWRSYV